MKNKSNYNVELHEADSKKIIIINGPATSGKDTFVKIFQEKYPSINFSCVDSIKKIAKEIGWDGTKSDKDRKFLSDLKILTSEYNDFSFNNTLNIIKEFASSSDKEKYLFIHMREAKDIERTKRAANIIGLKVVTLLLTNKNVKHNTSNVADANVFDYSYDYHVKNDGTIDDLKNIVDEFYQEIQKI